MYFEKTQCMEQQRQQPTRSHSEVVEFLHLVSNFRCQTQKKKPTLQVRIIHGRWLLLFNGFLGNRGECGGTTMKVQAVKLRVGRAEGMVEGCQEPPTFRGCWIKVFASRNIKMPRPCSFFPRSSHMLLLPNTQPRSCLCKT